MSQVFTSLGHMLLPLDKNTKGGIPDSTQYIRAYRCWDVNDNGLLASVTGCEEWLPHQPKVSACKYCNTKLHGCGIYASKTPTEFRLSGQVAIWGVIHEHKNGYRAQYAYPISFDRAFCGISHKPNCVSLVVNSRAEVELLQHLTKM